MQSAQVEGLALDSQNNQVMVLLRSEKGQRLPVVIGQLEAHHIAVGLANQSPPRPLMPDLFLNTLEVLGAKVKRIEITDLREGTFYALLVLEQRGLELELDARPSDSLALAVRTQAPIWINEAVLQQAALPPENPQA